MRLIIIGSKGFIGSHCVSYFKNSGYEVTGCDVIESQEPNYIHLNSIQDFNGIFMGQHYDYCINAAGSAHVNYSFQYPEKDFELNVSLVINLLGAIKNNCPSCRFINFSSAAVYGNPPALPVKEEMAVKPLSPYGYHKLLSEKLLCEYYSFFNLNTCSLRVFSAYGEGLKKQLFWDLYTKSVNSDAVQLYGTGNESRDFIYISDLVAIVHLIMSKGEFKGEVYNIGNGEEIFIKEAASVFCKEMKWTGEIKFSGEEKAGDPINWKADISKIVQMGYKRKFSFEEGLRNYCTWLREKH